MADDLFATLGLGPGAQALYTELLAHGQRHPSSRSCPGGLTPEQTDEVLKELERAGLAARDPQGVLRPCPPRAAVELWAARREVEAIQARQAGAVLGRLYAASRTAARDFVEIIQDHEATVELVRALRGRAGHQVRGLVRGPGLPAMSPDPVPEQVEGAERGVVYRKVYDAAIVADEARLQGIARCRDTGELGRTFAGVPFTMLVSDDEVAVIVLPGPAGSSLALAVYPSGLLEALIELFESFWRIALPVGAPAAASTPDAEPPRGDPGPIDDDERRLLQLLATGLTDAVIAKTLGVSERTVHRRLRRLQERCGVQSRFQLGMHAARQHWL